MCYQTQQVANQDKAMRRRILCRIGWLASLLAASCAGPDDVPKANTAAQGLDAAADAAPAGDATADGETAIDGAAADAPAADAPVVKCSTAADCPLAAACHVAVCSAAGTCASQPATDGAPCSDGNACTEGDTCTGAVCAGGIALACDDGSPCTADFCNPVVGCVLLPAPASTACDDGNGCTQEDTCVGGKCLSGKTICQCESAADCGKFEDGNFCNGTLYCDKSGGAPFKCQINPATLVQCVTSADNACQKNVCVPVTGACQLQLAPTNTACDDGKACTVGDVCATGLCQGGTNTCFCKNDADCSAAEDGDACNGKLFCNKVTAKCQMNPATVVTCQSVDDTACRKNLCNPKDGKCQQIAVNAGKPCDDGNSCTPNEAC